MKKLLSIVFALTITTLPALAGKRADCEQAINISQFEDWPDKYRTMAQNVLNKPLDKSMNAQYSTGVGCTARCTAGQKLQDCVTPTQYKDECAKIFANDLIKEQYESEFKEYLCGYISENEESNFRDMMDDNKISYWVEYKKNNYTATPTSSDIAPAVESQNSTSSTETMTVSGTVLDENNEPLVYATISYDKSGTLTGTTTDDYGYFELKNVPSNAKLEVSYVGYHKQKINPGENQKIALIPNAQLDDVVITACGGDKANGIKSKTMIDGKCYPSACVEPRWTLLGTDKNSKCVEQKCEFKHGTGKWEQNGDTWKCTLKECDTTKGWKKNDAGDACIEMLAECTDKQKAAHQYATKTGIKKGTETCIAQECKCGFKLEGEKCVQWAEKEQCTTDTKPKLPGNAKSAIMKCDGEKAYCEIADCNDGYKVSEDKKSCVSTRGDDCDATAVDPNATAGTNKKVRGKMTCVITDCAHGFAPNKDGTKCVAGELSESDSLAKIDELRDNAQKMKDKEQSTANKLLGAAGIGATGIGGMQMASAMAEENADADAERAMRAYLATFHCNYGNTKNIAGGERDVELPGGNELINLYSEYVNLANDLKTRKTALDMRPGIESESILDAATSGLYDDVAIGKTSGAYTSLARALMDPTGADAAAWAAQKKETADKKKTGMITAGIGAAGSLIGNLAINSGKDKQNKVDEILNKYEKLKQTFDSAQQEFDEIPGQPCSDFTGTTGTGTAPNCECSDTKNTRFSKENGGCIACENGKVYDESNTCVCPSNKPREVNGTCEAQLPECTLTGLVTSNECKCIDNAKQEGQQCKCNTGYTEKNDACVQNTVPPVEKTEPLVSPVTLDIKSDTAFVSGTAKLTTPKGQEALNKFINDINEQKSELSDDNFCITITGHTDRVPFKKTAKKTNEQLSLDRANKIKEELITKAEITEQHIKTIGKGDTECTPNTYHNADSADCRRVHIVLTSGKCQS